MQNNPYSPPSAAVSDVEADADDIEYVGFWARVGAAIIDGLLVFAITSPMLIGIYGMSYFSGTDEFFRGPAEILISYVLPAVLTILFWLKKQATPGKMAISAKVVDAKTGATLSMGQSILRYIGYFISALPLGLGLIWVGFDARKQGWHDKIAGTVVVRRWSSRR